MEMSELNLEVTTSDGKIEFFYKISGARMIYFYIDDNMVGTLGQTADWTNAQYDITEGAHTFRWVFYIFMGGSLEDKAWLDNLRIFSPN